MQEAALYYHAVATAAGGDYRAIADLKRVFGGWRHAYEALANRGLPQPALHEAWKRLEENNARLILFEDDAYPALLKEIPDPPFGIYVRGTLPQAAGGASTSTEAAIAIVGTRRATPEGKAITQRFARELAQCGLAVISGLAFGIDAAAHVGCLEAEGITVAVLAGGLHDIYPGENRRLADKILAHGGALVSEYPPGSPPYPARFLERNRIVSGLARGALIVEAPVGSGALATARFALEQNREVFVVPGPIAQKNFAGSHRLIRQGAELITAPAEILDALGIPRGARIAAQMNAAPPEETLILEVLQEVRAPADVDKIAAAAKLEPRIVNRAISFLLLRDIIKETNGGYTIK